jgi:dephospho-CoA kinase
MTRIVSLTGGIGSGKSTVARMLEELGAVVIDADGIVHDLQAAGMPMLEQLADAFGPEILEPDGALRREELGKLVFSDEVARLKLNAIVHPQVGAEFARRVAAEKEAGVPLIVLDIPLLFEGRKAGSRSASAMQTEAVIVVWVSRETQLERQMARDGRGREDAEARIDSQLPLDEKRDLADFVIDNSGTLEETAAQVRSIYASLAN